MLLFQEIPGCETCKNFGQNPLSHPLLVEAMEDLFVPVAIFNNKKGKDEQILKAFKEPAWNNPVIRYLDKNGKDIIDRQDGVWNVSGTAQRMVAALTAAKKDVPTYLRVLAEPVKSKSVATFAMHCYWEGEANLGKLDGVHNTHSAWIGEKEVVEVTFDSAIIDFGKLIDHAKKMKCASTVFANNEKQLKIAESKVGNAAQLLKKKQNARAAKLSDQKYYLRQTPIRHLPLTTLQSTKINAALYAKSDGKRFLSPRQLKMLKDIENQQRANPKALSDLVFPDDDSKLAKYSEKLQQVLSKK